MTPPRAPGETPSPFLAEAISDTSASDSPSVEDLAMQGQEAVAQLQDQAGRLVDLARDQVRLRISDQQVNLASSLEQVATAIRQTGQQLGSQPEQEALAHYIDAAANQVDQIAEMLGSKDLEELATTIGSYARRQPAPFLAAAFALGFAGVRFFKSSTSGASSASSSASMSGGYRGQEPATTELGTGSYNAFGSTMLGEQTELDANAFDAFGSPVLADEIDVVVVDDIDLDPEAR